MTNRGVQFEKQIVRCYRLRDFNNPDYMDGVVPATQHLAAAFPHSTLVHRDEISLRGEGLGREIKADLWVDGFGVSVKMDGVVQLSSAEGGRTASTFEKVYFAVKHLLTPPEQEQVRGMIRDVRELPTVMVSNTNREKAKKRNPRKYSMATDYDSWKEDERPHLNESLKHSFDIDSFRIATIEEMLTGRLWFANSKGVADYILTPRYFKYIDRAYVRSVADASKVDIRGKSRGGISSGVVRFDTKI